MTFQFQEGNQILLTSVLTFMMPMEMLQNQIQFLVRGHTEFGPTTTMLRTQSNVHSDVTLEKLKIVHFTIGDLDIVTWVISTLIQTNQLGTMMKTQSIKYVKILVCFQIWVRHVRFYVEYSILILLFSLLDFAVWSEYYNSNTNDGNCQNHGYRQLNNNGDYIDITSGGHNYDDNERCYWGIYAPGAQKLEFQLTSNLRVSSWYDSDYDNTRDFLKVYLGVGKGAYNVLEFKSSYNKKCCWEYEAELMSLFWSTNSNGDAYGFDARITRIG